MLAGWLTAAADPPEIHARQAAVEELARALDLREQLAVSGDLVRASVHTDRLLDWAESPMPPHSTLRAVIWFYTVATLLAVLYLAFTSVWWPLAVILVLNAGSLRRFRDEMNAILSTEASGTAADFVADPLTHRSLDLNVLVNLLAHIERAGFVLQVTCRERFIHLHAQRGTFLHIIVRFRKIEIASRTRHHNGACATCLRMEVHLFGGER
jgi:hypothetical protein